MYSHKPSPTDERFMPLPDAARPLYEKVKSYILGKIGSGEWNEDRRVPSENELVRSLGVSRMTIHRAFRELSAAGMLLRIPGVGTFVAPAKPQSALIEIRDIAEEIRARGHRHRAEVLKLERVTTTNDLVRAFEFRRGRRVFHSIILHFENDLPVQLEERHVNPDIASGYLAQDFTKVTTYEYLQKQTPVTEVEHIIAARRADDAASRALGIGKSDPCLILRRRTWSGALVATVNRFVYPGERFSLGSRYKIADRN